MATAVKMATSSQPKMIANLLWIALVVFLSTQAAKLTWLVFEGADQNVVISASSAMSEGGGNDGADPSVVLPLNMFGKQSAEKRQAVTSKVVAPKTRLQLELRGVFTGQTEEDSGAIVAQRGREGEYFRIGDRLPGNAELVAVHEDRILLQRNGALETLAFAEIRDTSLVQQQPRVSSPRQFVDEANRRLSQNPEAALQSVGLKPASGGGYVYDGSNPMLRALNMQEGDVIRSVNGHSLGDITQDRKLLEELYQQGSLAVEVERDGTVFSVNYPLR